MKLPPLFTERMQQLLGNDYEAFAHALTEAEQPTSIRINIHKGAQAPAEATPVPWSGGSGYYLPSRPTFTFDPLFHAGAYYVQEASSMFLGTVIQQYIDQPVRYLDLCAAPGGKSTLALSLLPEGSLVVSNEIVRQRAQVLAENIAKWGNPYSVVTNNSPADWGTWHNYFDVIATDVPCSGEGMFRKDETAIAEWSPANVEHCATRQAGILADVWSALRPGGLLIYSTCTYNIEENEAMIQHLIKVYDAQPLAVKTNPTWGITNALMGEAPAYRFMPHHTRGEGLFMALLRKPGNADSDCGTAPKEKKKKKGEKKNNPTIPAEAKSWLATQDFHYEADETAIYAYPLRYADDMQAMQRSFNVLHAGIEIATIKGRDLIPAHTLALSTLLNREAFASCQVSLETALAYLRRESITLPPDAPRGYVAVVYKGFTLGWVKNLGTRANNLYPQEWRIRSPHNPENMVEAGVTAIE
ncbi:MAG: rRNA cytosine-C5-methyltransferase [Bacteroidales bacterium]|nr:rRNA cytosine-C5-methyltransferase [Bacteroidales bacterium]MBP3670670.1 rRNA cytosine-C5-methyltransferase [Bacteroidaceae bacterium]